jgi:hypothetical protein
MFGAHLEYFMNTLNVAHARQVINPYKQPDQFKAFDFQAEVSIEGSSMESSMKSG